MTGRASGSDWTRANPAICLPGRIGFGFPKAIQPSARRSAHVISVANSDRDDWKGKWIGLDQGESGDLLAGANWIWFPEGNPAVSAPVGTRYFRREFRSG